MTGLSVLPSVVSLRERACESAICRPRGEWARGIGRQRPTAASRIGYADRVAERTIVVGDVHGCSSELDALYRLCEVGPGDELVFVGDLVAKGPDSAGVLARMRAWNARSVRGNHDAAAVACRLLPEHQVPVHRRALVASLSDQDLALLAGLPLWLRLSRGLVVHAGIVPGLALERQDPYLLMNMRTLDEQGRGSRSAAPGQLWGAAYPGPELILFGHHARAGLQLHPFALGLDTGCVYGGRLTACILPERRIVSVPARRAYTATSDARSRR